MERDIASEKGDEQAAWRDLVARLESSGSYEPSCAPWPDRENLPGIEDGRRKPSAIELGHVVRPARPPQSAEPPDEAGCDGYDDLDDLDDTDDEYYLPPPLAPLPVVDPVTRGAWLALFGGPGYLFAAALLNWQLSGWAELAAILAFVTGFLVLMLRLGDGPSRRDDPDEGAVV